MPTFSSATAYGWELHYESSLENSDKYYRVVVIDHIVLVNYGRRDTKGNFVTHRFRDSTNARAKARELTNAKSREGYVLTRDMTPFTVNFVFYSALTDEPVAGSNRNTNKNACKAIIDEFKERAHNLGNTMRGASR